MGCCDSGFVIVIQPRDSARVLLVQARDPLLLEL